VERLTLAAGCSYFLPNDYPGFQENLQYVGTSAFKLHGDTRAVRERLELAQSFAANLIYRSFPGATQRKPRQRGMPFLRCVCHWFQARVRLQDPGILCSAALAGWPNWHHRLEHPAKQSSGLTTRPFMLRWASFFFPMNETGACDYFPSWPGGGRAEEFKDRAGVGFPGGIAQTGEPT